VKRNIALMAAATAGLIAVVTPTATATTERTDPVARAIQQTESVRDVIQRVVQGDRSRLTTEDPVLRFVNVNSKRCLDVTGGTVTDRTQVQQYDCVDVRQQEFQVVNVDGAFTGLKALHAPDQCLNIRDAGQANGDLLQTYTCDPDDPAQRFAMVEQTDRSVALVPQHTMEANILRPKCLDVRDRSVENNAVIQQWDCTTPHGENSDVAPAQRFQVLSAG
jgi:hypothetical protein